MHLSLGKFPVRASLTAIALALSLAGCEELGGTAVEATPAAASGGTASVSREVERPDVFSVTERALWDGRPSLGGVWVAYPANVDPERVIIRNTTNGKSVVGALFRRERDNPGPNIQLSSDAAVALGVVAGTPTEISIVVLRREEVEVEVSAPSVAPVDGNMTIPPRRAVPAASAPAPVAAPVVAAPEADSAASLAAIVEQTLDDVAASESAVPVAAPAPARPFAELFRLRKPYIQISTFENESNAEALVTVLAADGVNAQLQANDPENPTLWRVISGPYETRAARSAQLRIIKDLGYTDAFFFK